MSRSSDRSAPPAPSTATAAAPAVSQIAPRAIASPAAPPRHFTLIYKPSAGVTLQREIAGTLVDALSIACGMLRDGSAKHLNLIETGRIDGVVPHSQIVRWCTGRPEAP
ncbi:MAG: hypothetical protein HXX10_12775 [Rhodoplanes sp.]|uniref:hypothetical protein n=1 Tax=Rhodoplanes sp. TaxID=1968906 RepID=UPI0017C45181|nr:hypothetical protein [Rhodoplanes sp.]NVO14902.1 hypothetical protein [Rhodoplanes sp.]